MYIKILVADDDAMLRRLLADILRKQDYQVFLAENGEEAQALFFKEKGISLCILDVMMPKATGLEVLATIRAHSDVPVILLTALDEEVHELKGLKQGADDYIAKPFSYEILLARVENLLKKGQKILGQQMEKGEIFVDLLSHTVEVEGTEVVLNNKEFSLLCHFMENENLVLTREQLLEKIWGFGYEGEIRTVDTHVKMLRKKLGKWGEYVVTVRGTGYKFQVKP